MAVAGAQSQSIKSSERGGLGNGFDGYKQVQGCKRHPAVDTGGRLLTAPVGLANEDDRIGGRAVREKLHQQGFKRLPPVLTGAGYDGPGLWPSGSRLAAAGGSQQRPV